MIRRFAVRALLIAVAVPCLYLGTASARFLYRQRAANRGDEPTSARPTFEAITGDQRILVVSPHPDDEVLACGGLLQRAVAAGAWVRVVYATNGDGFRIAAQRQRRTVNLLASDYVGFGRLRQTETLRALARVRVRAAQAVYLGYPDGALNALWTTNWSPDDPLRTTTTEADRSPYADSYREHALYCGQYVLDDLELLLAQSEPTDIYVPHPLDDHRDHSAVSAFAVRALQSLREQGVPWALLCRVHYWIVHRSSWPAPGGLHPTLSQPPPMGVSDGETTWTAFPLTEREERAKLAAIREYRSQTAVMRPFMESFVRTNEVFGTMPDRVFRRVPDAVGPCGVEPVALDPVHDSLLRTLDGNGDIKSIDACRDDSNLYLRVVTVAPLASRATCTVRLRAFGRGGGAGAYQRIVMRGNGYVSPAEWRCDRNSEGTTLRIPLRDLGYPQSVAVEATTSMGQVLVDRTGFRFISL